MNGTKCLNDADFQKTLGTLSFSSDRLWLLGMAIGIGFTLVATLFFPYPNSPSGKFWVYASLLSRGALYFTAGETARGRGGEVLRLLLVMGIVAGLFELLVDWGLIHWVSSGALVYLTGNDVVLLGSPLWMPLAWACVIVELGYLALRLFGFLQARLGVIQSAILVSLVTGITAGVMVGFYEYFAFKAGWWKYLPAKAMLGDYCALYIPLGEFLMFLTILPIAARVISDRDRPWTALIGGGFLFSLAIAGGYFLAYLILELGR